MLLKVPTRQLVAANLLTTLVLLCVAVATLVLVLVVGFKR